MPDALSVLDGIRERAAWVETPRRMDASVSLSLAAAKSARDVPTLLAVADAVLKLHQPYTRHAGTGMTVTLCGRCHDHWPCREVEDISRALGVAQTSSEEESA